MPNRPATCTLVACRHHPAEPVTADCKRYVAVHGSKAHCAYQPSDCAAYEERTRRLRAPKPKPKAVPAEVEPEPVEVGEGEQLRLWV